MRKQFPDPPPLPKVYVYEVVINWSSKAQDKVSDILSVVVLPDINSISITSIDGVQRVVHLRRVDWYSIAPIREYDKVSLA